MARALDRKPEMTNTRADFYHRIEGDSLAPLWEVLSTLMSPEPKTEAVPHVWHYDHIRGHVLEAGEIITAEEAERRVLILENPGMHGQSRITETLFAGLQLILPGEVAPTHRHSPCALRYIQEGSGAYTSVGGEKAYMEPGDLILTPSWHWHDHGHEGTEPVVWLDGLDMPVIRRVGAMFTESYKNRGTYPLSRPVGDSIARFGDGLVPMGYTPPDENSPAFHYPYARTREALSRLGKASDIDKYHGIKMEYVNPTNGGPVMPTVSCYMQLLPKSFKTETYQTTASWVYACREGKGRTIVGDKTLEWGPRDVFVVPCWAKHHHEATDESVLFSFSDARMQQKLGLWREVRTH
jgi:gentisate 1,2-dioxygenase